MPFKTDESKLPQEIAIFTPVFKQCEGNAKHFELIADGDHFDYLARLTLIP